MMMLLLLWMLLLLLLRGTVRRCEMNPYVSRDVPVLERMEEERRVSNVGMLRGRRRRSG